MVNVWMLVWWHCDIIFVSFYVQKKCSPAARELPCVFCKQADNSILIGQAVNDDGKNKYVARVVECNVLSVLT